MSNKHTCAGSWRREHFDFDEIAIEEYLRNKTHPSMSLRDYGSKIKFSNFRFSQQNATK